MYFYNEEYFFNGEIVAEKTNLEKFPRGMRFHYVKDTGPYGYVVSVNKTPEGAFLVRTDGCAKRTRMIIATGATLDEALMNYVIQWKG